MSGRYKKLYIQGVYHVFNKTINNFPVFKFDSNCNLFLKTIRYYRSSKATLSLSLLNRLSEDQLDSLNQLINCRKYFKIDIIAYTLMPNHYHFIIQQLADNGLSKFINDVFNSYTRHLNIKQERKGSIFLSKYKAEPIKTDESLVHVSRYIHINAYMANLVTSLDDMINYPWSSYKEYISGKNDLCNTKPILSLFNNNPNSYQKFCQNHADYKKSLLQLSYLKNWH